MTLIKSISGIRGTIGGKVGQSLTPPDVVKFASAFGTWLKRKHPENPKVIIGRDARLSGNMVNKLVIATLQGLGIDVVDLGLSTTPTVEIAVPAELLAVSFSRPVTIQFSGMPSNCSITPENLSRAKMAKKCLILQKTPILIL
jgi:hypothetical protein